MGIAVLADQPQVAATLVPHLGSIVTTALVLAVTGTLDSVLSLRALDQHLDERSDGTREVAALGWANLAGGLASALPVGFMRSRAMAAVHAGGHGRAAALGAAAASALLFVIGGPWVGLLPQAVLAGAMVVVGVALADR